MTFIDSKTPGLLTQPDFVKALGMLSAEERKGQIVYADAKTLLSAAAMLGLPLLQARLTDEEMKKALAGLPPGQQLFKDIPPLVGATVQRAGHVETVLRSPLPPLSTGVVLGVGALIGVRQAMPPPAPPAQEPPGKF
ncbi:MAG: hypothetical protein NTW87_31855 [Planctomycetota bacterium]|nr:hypothetical protein [Planctomycetota bacterium]